MVNCSASTACHECSGSSHHELVARPRETSAEAATLAAGSAKNYIQAVSVHAPHPQRAPQYLPDCVSTVSAASHIQILAEVVWLSGLRSA